mmetsp:Transcript_6432/g.13667  ORF Transcript_6432/g.13667 Transcript_6432/m.13667 type:complete len:110 (-) Transcript_6432:62-391(-)
MDDRRRQSDDRPGSRDDRWNSKQEGVAAPLLAAVVAAMAAAVAAATARVRVDAASATSCRKEEFVEMSDNEGAVTDPRRRMTKGGNVKKKAVTLTGGFHVRGILPIIFQ